MWGHRTRARGLIANAEPIEALARRAGYGSSGVDPVDIPHSKCPAAIGAPPPPHLERVRDDIGDSYASDGHDGY